ncbi:hypothetical protein [Paraburkholderia acidisoli]|uniref:Secreted protein n=1 Tax=Paraburkholderia acidisoli TaxID=2571748 RepID=A0A7Z2GRT2_9BURK|nr:hypothetical protein [Paraburkholderia acidisoli]QGZ66781.1 hypothetical protein FAZ98_34145 [Paraburkholderia acidisoli]
MRALNFRRLVLVLAVPLLAFALPYGDAAEPATMLVSLVVQQSCVVSSNGGTAIAPVVNCAHGEPWLLSQTDTTTGSAPSRLRAAADSVWTVVF